MIREIGETCWNFAILLKSRRQQENELLRRSTPDAADVAASALACNDDDKGRHLSLGEELLLSSEDFASSQWREAWDSGPMSLIGAVVAAAGDADALVGGAPWITVGRHGVHGVLGAGSKAESTALDVDRYSSSSSSGFCDESTRSLGHPHRYNTAGVSPTRVFLHFDRVLAPPNRSVGWQHWRRFLASLDRRSSSYFVKFH